MPSKSLRTDPKYVSMHAQGIVVEDLMRLAEKEGLSGPTAFGEAIGDSRQYAEQILNQKISTNFKIETLAKFTTALKGKLVVRIISDDEYAPILDRSEWEKIKSMRFAPSTTMDAKRPNNYGSSEPESTPQLETKLSGSTRLIPSEIIDESKGATQLQETV